MDGHKNFVKHDTLISYNKTEILLYCNNTLQKLNGQMSRTHQETDVLATN